MWTQELFGVEKPIIALLHLAALPGDPGYDRAGGMKAVVERARKELTALQNGGVDGILFANEFSKPYQTNAPHATVSAMARIVGELMPELRVPYGVNVVLNPMACIDLAAATDASFVRSAFTGAYMGEYGLHTTDVAAAVRRKMELGLTDLKLLYKVNPESDAYLAQRDLTAITKSILFQCEPDGLCVSGASAGCEASSSLVEIVKKASPNVPVFCNTGCNAGNIREKLAISDGACVGTAFKEGGKFYAQVDEDRVREFMDIVKDYRRHC